MNLSYVQNIKIYTSKDKQKIDCLYMSLIRSNLLRDMWNFST